MQKQIQHAKALMEQGFKIIPLFKNSKFNGDTQIIDRDYTLEHLAKPLLNKSGAPMWDVDGNQGINLEKSKLIDIDLENFWSIKFGGMWLPTDTLTLGRIRPGVDNAEQTHYFYDNAEGIDEDIMLDKHVAEFRVIGQTVVFGTTKDKVTGEPLERTWTNVKKPKKVAREVLEKIFRKISFAAKIAPLVESANTGALKLDACLKRYTKWSKEERIEFLFDFYTAVLPNDRDTKKNKMVRIVASNDRETKNAGYQSYAKYIGLKMADMKEILGWIGTMPGSEEFKETPSRRDFLTNGIDLKALMDEDIPPLKYAIDKILPEGLVCIAGRPKAMKSWSAYKMCYCVENGIPFLGHTVEQGKSLYLALEDSKRRLKERAYKMKLNKMLRHPTTDIDAPYLGMGLEEDIQKWIDGVENPKLIVIDTLARVKAKTFSKGTAYDMDNELLRKLQQLAITNGVCIVLITHLSKASQDYNYDKITGSVGLQGMTDAMWLIDRGDGSPNASIIGRGRDILDFEYAVKWHDETMQYEYVGDKVLVELNENREVIIKAMTELSKVRKGGKVRPKDVNDLLGFNGTSKEGKNISRTMQRMAYNLEITKSTTFGRYELNSSIEHDNF